MVVATIFTSSRKPNKPLKERRAHKKMCARLSESVTPQDPRFIAALGDLLGRASQQRFLFRSLLHRLRCSAASARQAFIACACRWACTLSYVCGPASFSTAS